MADESSSLDIVIPSIFIYTIVNTWPEKDRFRRGVLDPPDIIIIGTVRYKVAPGCGRIILCLGTPLLENTTLRFLPCHFSINYKKMVIYKSIYAFYKNVKSQ